MIWIIQAEQSSLTNPLYWGVDNNWTGNVAFAKKYDTFAQAQTEAETFRFTNPRITMADQ